jgi:formiminotetrahydrofolate cyclodeaminase
MVARVRDVPDVVPRTDALRAAALELAVADARAVEEVAAAYRLPRSTDAERERRAAAIADTLLAAAEPPARAVPLGAEMLGLCERLAEVATGALRADVAAAAEATAAALRISRTNVEADVTGRRGSPEADRLAAAVEQVDALVERATRLSSG